MLSNYVIADDIPVIVIAPSQKAQSKSTVGTSVTVFDQAYIENHNGYFLPNGLRAYLWPHRPNSIHNKYQPWKYSYVWMYMLE